MARGGRSIDVFVHSDHLVGLGHYLRTRCVVHALLNGGYRVLWALGSPVPCALRPDPRVVLLNLPPFPVGSRQDAGASDLGVWQKCAELRAAVLVDALHRACPRLVLTETFPFGRQQRAFELLKLLRAVQACRPRPLVAASIRDVNRWPAEEPKRTQRRLDAYALCSVFYDHVLVHSDGRHWSVTEALDGLEPTIPVWFTGYLDDARASQPQCRRPMLLALAGGGAVGFRLLSTAIQASIEEKLDGRDLVVICGPLMPESDCIRLRRLARGKRRIRILRSVRNVRPIMSRSQAVACQLGYNTFVDVLRTKTPCVAVPFEASADQGARARLLQEKNLAALVPEAELDSDSLRAAVARVVTSRPAAESFDMNGAQRTRELVQSWLSG